MKEGLGQISKGFFNSQRELELAVFCIKVKYYPCALKEAQNNKGLRNKSMKHKSEFVH